VQTGSLNDMQLGLQFAVHANDELLLIASSGKLGILFNGAW
jgi:hypothetical protein